MALAAANVIPLFGAVLWGWSAFNIIFLFWAENFAVGFYTILKMAFAKVPRRAALGKGKKFNIAFFTIHYGGFTGIHGFIVLMIFKTFRKEEAASVMSPHMMGALVALFLSHGVSFVRNYLFKGEFASARLEKLMFNPYPRMLVMHIATIAGGFLLMRSGSPLGLLAVLIVLKTAIDIIGHLWEHKKAKALKLKLGEFSIQIGNDETSIEQGVTKMADKEVLVLCR